MNNSMNGSVNATHWGFLCKDTSQSIWKGSMQCEFWRLRGRHHLLVLVRWGSGGAAEQRGAEQSVPHLTHHSARPLARDGTLCHRDMPARPAPLPETPLGSRLHTGTYSIDVFFSVSVGFYYILFIYYTFSSPLVVTFSC